MKIITTTLNPAFDLHFHMKSFELYKENYVDSVLVAAGGKGINISRALSKNNIANTAYVVLGKENAADFVLKLEADALPFKGIFCEGRIRENITVHTPGMPETRISLDSFSLSEAILHQLFEELLQVGDDQTILTFSGRIPGGLSVDCVINLLGELRNRGCLLAVDCNSFSLEALTRIKPWLVKPNQQELQSLVGKQIDTVGQAVEIAQKIHEKGVENVIISMGKEGAAAVVGGVNYFVSVPAITPLSTIGAGDSMIAGFIGTYAQGSSPEACLKNAAAYGTSACLAQGTNPPGICDINRMREHIRVIQM